MSKKALLVLALITFALSAVLVAAAPAPYATGVAASLVAKNKAPKPPDVQLIDINEATKEQLVTLPGIGDETAQKIIDNRPYVTADQLVAKKVLTKAELKKIKSSIVVREKK